MAAFDAMSTPFVTQWNGPVLCGGMATLRLPEAAGPIGYIRPIEQNEQKNLNVSRGGSETRRRRRRRGGRKVRARRDAEKRIDPTDGALRTWDGFMMKHAQGADFALADDLWAAALVPNTPPCEESDEWDEDDEDDGPPPLLEDPHTPILELPELERSTKSVCFADTTVSTDSEPTQGGQSSEGLPRRPSSILKTRSHPTC